MANIGTGLPYIPSGFRLDGSVDEGDVVWLLQDTSQTITQGMAVKSVSGYIQAMGGAFAAGFMGIALFAQTTTTVHLSLAVIKPNPNKYFWAPVLSATLVTQSAVGTMVDLYSTTAIGVDITDTTLASWGFEVSDFDASTLAVAANAAGFVRGRFIAQPQ
jgi:hypothetical protein